MEDMEGFPFEYIAPEEELRTLETVQVYVSDVETNKTAEVLNFVNKFLPQVTDLEHLKRIRRIVHHDKTFTLNIILCCALDITLSDLLITISEHNLLSALSPHEYSAPKYAPVTRDQFVEWKELWPINFRDDPKRAIKFSKDEIKVIESNMKSVLNTAQEAGSNNDLPIAALIVSPQNSILFASAYDTRFSTSHPLRHAVMNCIDAVATVARVNLSTSKTNEAHVQSKHNLSEIEASYSALGQSAYLCTSYDLYVSHEPCIMCSMALVHSRIARVFYCRPSASGGLGSLYKIQSHSSLNHHFRIFRRVLEKEWEVLGLANMEGIDI